MTNDMIRDLTSLESDQVNGGTVQDAIDYLRGVADGMVDALSKLL